MPLSPTPTYDLVVFGATSFVGQIITRYLVDQYGSNGPVRWAIAGRSETKLAALRDTLGEPGQTLPIIVADAHAADDLRNVCSQTTVVLSTVGPYALYGEPLVKACAETGTDYCDLTGEVQWVKRMIDRYDTVARQTGSRLVHCCGYDSIPSDIGVYFLQQEAKKRFRQACSTVTMRVKSAKGGVSGGTIASMLNLLKDAATDAELRRELADPYALCPPVDYEQPNQKTVASVVYDDDAASWMAPFVMAGVNEKVVQRSNALLHYHPNFTYNEAMLTGSGPLGFMASATVTAALGLFMATAVTPPLRKIIERFLPKPGEGPGPEAQRTGFFVHEVRGKTETGQTLLVRVSGDRDPGYGSTAKMIAQAGLSLAQDVAKADKPGGFYTPAAIFDERLIARLQNFSGLTFTVTN
jgi:short subunit dehydrogenase-like uncharacterized protein